MNDKKTKVRGLRRWKIVEKCASAFIAELTKEEIAYCTNKERGEYIGFAALHDLMDANVELVDVIVALELPSNESPVKEEFSEDQIPFINRVMDQVNIQLKGRAK